MKYIFIGFTSCGKSSVAKALASELNIPFIDLDDEIINLAEKETGLKRSCRDIFKQDGESKFRDFESRALTSLASKESFILATGGGAPMHEPNQKILKDLAEIIYLEADAKTLFERMQISKGLPAFLQSDPTVENLQRILSSRELVYNSIASYRIKTDGLTISEVSNKVRALIKA